MKPTREQILSYFRESYVDEYAALGPEGVAEILRRGARWNLAPILQAGGVLVFPHVHIADCGPYTAAVVHACFEAGTDSILAIGVLHAYSDEMDAAKVRVASGLSEAEDEPLRGIYGPGLSNELATWTNDHGFIGFRRLLQDEGNRRGIQAPTLVERYPYLTGPHPESLPGMAELQSIAKDSVVVSTADHCHHGIAYGDSPDETLYFDEKGLAEIRRRIQYGLDLLDQHRFEEYIRHCHEVVKSDWRDAGPVVHHLRGPLVSTVLDLVPSDFSNSIYQAPTPTWAAGALVQLERRR